MPHPTLPLGLALCLLALPGSASAQTLPNRAPPNHARPVLARAGRAPLVVISTASRPEWERGPLRLLHREWPTEVARAASVSRLPADTRRELLGTYRLYAGEREVCIARLGRPLAFRHVQPEEDLGTTGLARGETALSRAQVAALAWGLLEQSLLVAPAEPVRGDCAGASWASREPMRFSVSVEPDTDTLAAFRGLPIYLELATEWSRTGRRDDEDPTAVHWDARSAGAKRTVTQLSIGERTFVLIAADAHSGCGEFIGGLWAVYEIGEEGLTLIASDTTDTRPRSLADLDADGVPEVLGSQRYRSLTGGPSADLTAPDHGCSC